MHFSKVEICGVNTAKLQNLTEEINSVAKKIESL